MAVTRFPCFNSMFYTLFICFAFDISKDSTAFYFNISVQIFCIICSFVLYSMVFCDRFIFECFVPNIRLISKQVLTKSLTSIRWHFYIGFRFCETLAVINSVTRLSLTEALYKFRTMKCLFTLYLHIYALG